MFNHWSGLHSSTLIAQGRIFCFVPTLEIIAHLHCFCVSSHFQNSLQSTAKMICAIGFVFVGVLAALVVASTAKAKKRHVGICHPFESKNTTSSQ
jgi:hypothetical protein